MTTPAADFDQQLVRWRHHLHRHPETGFNEVDTADYLARHLAALGLDVQRGIGGTGVVASLRVGSGRRSIGLRADMDALALGESAPGRAYASQNAGCMHACGHDGHMAMVLGAAQLLAERRDFDGTVRFILERVYDLYGAALERNRDEWMPRMRRMGSCPCKHPGRPIARFRPNPSGKSLAGRSAALRRLLIAGLSTAHRA